MKTTKDFFQLNAEISLEQMKELLRSDKISGTGNHPLDGRNWFLRNTSSSQCYKRFTGQY